MLQNGRRMRIGNDVFIPALWKGHREIIAFSDDGYSGKIWQLPPDWSDVTAVDIYNITAAGARLIESDRDTSNGLITLTLLEDGAVSIVPAGTVMDDIYEPEPLPSGEFLSDMNWTSAYAGYGQVQKDLSSCGKELILDGKYYSKGIGTHANSEIVYNIGGLYNRFLSTIGPDDLTFLDPDKHTSLIFKVYGDNLKLYESTVIRTSPYTEPLDIDIDVTGVNELKLVVTDSGDYNYSDAADWAHARLIQ